MYIMCVCLFSALSRRVDALQISIIIIILINKYMYFQPRSQLGVKQIQPTNQYFLTGVGNVRA